MNRIALPSSLIVMLLLTALPAHAESGWIYKGDINGDGIEDLLSSGPAAQFGNAGGPFVLQLSAEGGKTIRHVIELHPMAVALETPAAGQSAPPVLWAYRRHGGRSGSLVRLQLGAQLTQESVKISPGGLGTEIGDAIYSAVFAHRIEFSPVTDYTPPARPDGIEWGK